MSKYKPYIIIALCVIAVIFYITCGSCKDHDPYWEGQYSIISAQLDKLKVEKEAEISTLTSENVKLTAKIGHTTERIGVLESQIVSKSDTILGLEKEFTQLGDDKDAKINNLTKQVSIWKEKFTVAEEIIRNKDIIIFSLKEKYNNQLKISFDYKELYENVQFANISLELGLKKANKQITKLRVAGKIKNVACTVLAGIVLYKLVE